MKDLLALWATRAGVALFALVPFPLLYLLSDGLAFLMFRIVGYRRRVVLDNLRHSFPEKTEAERRAIARAFYRNLTDVLLETFKGNSMPADQFRRRTPGDFHILADALRADRPIVLMGSHYGNWEWISLAVKVHLPEKHILGVYKPLKNQALNAYFNRRRGRFGLDLVAMERAGYAMVKYRNSSCAFCLIADQTPSNTQTAHWLEFLHRETPFLPGGDKIARRLNIPVYFFDMRRYKRGYYRVTVSKLADDAGSLEEGEVTRLFARKLEGLLREAPADWLWSHRRWKHERPAEVPLRPLI